MRVSSRKVHVHLTFPVELTKEMNTLIGPGKRSEFIAAATARELERIKLLKALEVSAGAWSLKNHPDLRDAREIAMAVRKRRRKAEMKRKGASIGRLSS
ncbi:MAG: hypothetical protein HYU64_14785 [Armatimonadetes bacterium]|nr:hypothetical protein [Armatimonadota bacterium]